MIFETKRLLVARWKEGNLPVLYDLFNDPGIKEAVLPFLTLEETTDIFQKQVNSYDEFFPFGRYFIVEKENENVVGIFLLKKNKSGIEIGYTLKKENRNKGYATEIVKESIQWIKKLNSFEEVYAITETHNTNSQKVLLKSGFKQQENFLENQKEMTLFQKLLTS
jgi:RimJ/RimL family protein N-acetyltransferase